MKILCLSTYPIENPLHGGQHRLSNIVAELRADGHDVVSAGVIGSTSYPPSPFFAPGPKAEALAEVIEHYFLMEDWAISELFGVPGEYYSSLANRIKIVPDIIFVEQPWLFKFAELFNTQVCKGRSVLIYGSQNIEHRLKSEILRRYYDEKHVIAARDRVLACEIHAIRQSARTFCVSVNDLEWTRSHASQPPILAANGVIDRRASMADVAAANAITHGRKFALYCASAHPPNMDGFFDIFGNGAGCFPPECRMVVAGGAGHSIATDPRLARTGSLERQFVDAGQVSESVLRGLLATAHMILLPITSGGGTNLKSAEALWSGCHIVATTTAMRGFEIFMNARGVTVADDGPAFCNAVRRAFLLPNLQIDMEDRAERSVVLWENTLAAMVAGIRDVELIS